MSTFTDARNAIKAMWTANWPAPSGVPVYWHENIDTTVPDPGDADHWLHVLIEFDGDSLRAFGGGRLKNDRVLYGSITIRVFTARGMGEDTTLDLLDDASAAFRSRRSADGALSCVGDNPFPAPQADTQGLWWMRSVLVAFEFNYVG